MTADGTVGRVPSKLDRPPTVPAADLTTLCGHVEWLDNTKGRHGQALLTISTKCITMSAAACRELATLVSIAPPGKVHLNIGWMALERQIVIVPTGDGNFRASFTEGFNGTKIGGGTTVDMLVARGVKPGKYPVSVDRENQRLLADTRKMRGEGECAR